MSKSPRIYKRKAEPKISNAEMFQIKEISLFQFNSYHDFNWLHKQLKDDFKLIKNLEFDFQLSEFMHPFGIEQHVDEDILAAVIAENEERDSIPFVIHSGGQRIGLIFVTRMQNGLMLFEKLYVSHILRVYKQEQNIIRLVIDFIQSEDQQKKKQKGSFSKLRKILWVLRTSMPHTSFLLVRGLNFREIKQKKVKEEGLQTAKMFKLKLFNPHIHDRVEFLSEQQMLEIQHNRNKSIPQQDSAQRGSEEEYTGQVHKTIQPPIEEELKSKIYTMKVKHILKKNQLRKKVSPSQLQVPSLSSIPSMKHISSPILGQSPLLSLNNSRASSNLMVTTPSLPAFNSLKSSAILNNNYSQNVSILNSPSASFISNGDKQKKTWQFNPNIQEKFKIQLIRHKKQFELLEKEKLKFNPDTQSSQMKFLKQKTLNNLKKTQGNLISVKTLSDGTINFHRNSLAAHSFKDILEQKVNFDQIFKRKANASIQLNGGLEKTEEGDLLSLGKHQSNPSFPSYSYISHNGVNEATPMGNSFVKKIILKQFSENQ